MEISDIYSREFPSLLIPFCESEPMQRIRKIGMNCGCEYTSFPLFRDILVFSRYDHSVGTARIVWHFTKDPAQTLAALFHDVATPAFAHTVDFLNGDYLTQESTETGTEAILGTSPQILEHLTALGLNVSDVEDYHVYPIADNDSPRLSSDRLEYTIRNFLSFHFGTMEEAKSLYEDILVSENEDGNAELAFRSEEKAVRFAEIALETGKIYVSREDRCSMQCLSELLREALRRGVLKKHDLYTTEELVIRKISSEAHTADLWQRFRASAWVECSPVRGEGDGWMQVPAKKRYIDPLVSGRGRVSELSPAVRDKIEEFKSWDFSEWMKIQVSPGEEKHL